MAAANPEVPISLLVDKIETKFQRLPPIVEVQQLSATNGDTVASDILLNNFYVFMLDITTSGLRVAIFKNRLNLGYIIIGVSIMVSLYRASS